MADTGENGRPGITRLRLQQDIGFDAERFQLVGDPKAMVLSGDDDGASEQPRLGNAAQGLLKRR